MNVLVGQHAATKKPWHPPFFASHRGGARGDAPPRLRSNGLGCAGGALQGSPARACLARAFPRGVNLLCALRVIYTLRVSAKKQYPSTHFHRLSAGMHSLGEQLSLQRQRVADRIQAGKPFGVIYDQLQG